MSVKTLETLKSYFNTGDKPTESQFVDLIDSCYNNMESEALSVSTSTKSIGQFVTQTLKTITLVNNATYLVHGKLSVVPTTFFTLVCNGGYTSATHFGLATNTITIFTISVCSRPAINKVELAVLDVYYATKGSQASTGTDYTVYLTKIQRIR